MPHKGIYASYNEKENGPFDEAVEVSNSAYYLIWLDNSTINPLKLDLPTTIVIKLKGKQEFFKGVLKEIRHIDPDLLDDITNDAVHRPQVWRRLDHRTRLKDVKTALYISGLEQIPEPVELKGKHPPQSPVYIDFGD